MDAEYIAIGAAALVVVAGFVLAGELLPVQPGGNGERPVGEPGSEHLHAQLFISINGTEKVLNGSYLERAARVHLHGSDSILHVHADRVDLDYALRTLAISVNSSCIRFGLENESVCGYPATGVRVNGEQMSIDAAMDHGIAQGDTIVIWTGEQPPDGFDRELPPEYKEAAPGRSV
ncbi:MAG: hypothetical protein SVW02_02065 [Candidatus Nanohaloarchaea archaeon]|nr:hypothetical protein [Candidatus Nanohaloarchaea archaeon]